MGIQPLGVDSTVELLACGLGAGAADRWHGMTEGPRLPARIVPVFLDPSKSRAPLLAVRRYLRQFPRRNHGVVTVQHPAGPALAPYVAGECWHYLATADFRLQGFFRNPEPL